jgi:hypothetical protein
VLARGPNDEWALRARRSEADELTSLGRFGDAEAVYASLRGAHADAPYAKELAEAVERLHSARWHARLEVIAWLAIALLVLGAVTALVRDAGSPGAAARTLLRPPLEALFLLPVALLIAAAGQTENEAIAHASAWLAGAMLLDAWLVGASFVAARRAHGRLPLPHALGLGAGGGAAMLAAAYVIVRHTQLLDFIIHTVRFGVD